MISEYSDFHENMNALVHDLDLMMVCLTQNPYAFNMEKLETNKNCIDEMKNACDNLQTTRSNDNQFKKLGKIKHTLNELEQLLQPAIDEQANKECLEAETQKKEKSVVKAAKKTVSKKAKRKPTAVKKVVVRPKVKLAAISQKAKRKPTAVKKVVARPKVKLAAKSKKAKAKPKAVKKVVARPKVKLAAKSKKPVSGKKLAASKEKCLKMRAWRFHLNNER